MRADLILRIAADPNAVRNLSSREMCELLAEAKPPVWVFDEAARRTSDVTLLAHLFSHPLASAEQLSSTLGHNARLLDRVKYHVNLFEGKLELPDLFANLIPEVVSTPALRPDLERLLAAYLSPLCLAYLEFKDTEARAIRECRLPISDNPPIHLEGDTPASPRAYTPLARFVLLGDFLYYLTTDLALKVRELPVINKVALALNSEQPIEPFLNDADVRVRLAAKERTS